MRQTFEKVKSVAPTKTTVLLLGDTGVGKGTLAKLIHQHSSRKNEAFIHVHCGALPDTLAESELFGYEMVFIVIDKNTGQLGIFDCSPEFYAKGQDKVQRAVEAYKLFYKQKGFDPKQYFINKTL